MSLIFDTVELTDHKMDSLELQCDNLARHYPDRVKGLALSLAWIYRSARRAGLVDKEDYNQIMWGLDDAYKTLEAYARLSNGHMWHNSPCQREVVRASWACARLTPSAYREIIHLIKTGAKK